MSYEDVKLGNIFKERREQLGLTQEDLALKLGITKQRVYYYENGLRTMSGTLLFKFCDALMLEPNYIQSLFDD